MLICPLAVPLLPPGMSPHCQSPEMLVSFLLLPLVLPGTVLWPVALCEDGTWLPIALHSACWDRSPCGLPEPACLAPASPPHPWRWSGSLSCRLCLPKAQGSEGHNGRWT